MPDDPARPLCPICRRDTTALIATLKDARSIDIYLCQHCRAQFTYELPRTVKQPDRHGRFYDPDSPATPALKQVGAAKRE